MNLNNIQLDGQKKMLLVIVCGFLLYVDFAFILKTQIAGVNSVTPKIKRFENDLTVLKSDLANMKNLKSKPLDSQKAATKSIRVISEGMISGLLQEISNIANNNDVKIIQIKPARQAQSTAKQAASADKFIPFSINLDITCDYHSLGKFINELENGKFFLSVQDLKIFPGSLDYLKQKVTLILRTYVAK